MRKTIKIFAVLIILFFIWKMIFPLFLSDEKKIAKIIEKTAERTENRNAFQFMGFFDKSFADDSGLRFDELRAIGFRIFQMYKVIDVEHTINRIAVKENTAVVDMDLFITVTESETPVDLIHGARKTNTFIIDLEKKDGDWVFVKSRKPHGVYGHEPDVVHGK